jgi:4a-hydroxytetrahydrobiopterin dehydratase
MSRLDDAAIDHALTDLPAWRRDGDALVRALRFPDFPAAIAFLDRVVAPAEAANHHPDLAVSYTRVEIRLSSHDAGGITQRDLDLASQLDAITGPDAQPAD